MEKEIDRAYQNWTEYYKKCYETQKQLNQDLMPGFDGAMSKVSEQKAMLTYKIGYVENHPFWKMTKPLQKIFARFTNKVKEDTWISRYKEMAYYEQHAYEHWIKEVEVAREKELLNWKKQKKDLNTPKIAKVEIESLKDWAKVQALDAEYILFYSKAGTMRDNWEIWVQKSLEMHPEAVVLYGDEDFYWKSLENRMQPWFKPDWSPETLLAFFYFGHHVLVKKSELEEVSFLQDENGFANLYDLVLQITEKHTTIQKHGVDDLDAEGELIVQPIYHIKSVLFHQEYEHKEADSVYKLIPKRDYDVAKQQDVALQNELERGFNQIGCGASYHIVKERAFARRGITAHLAKSLETDQWHVIYDTKEEPKVSAVVLSKDHPDVLELCIKSLRERTDYNNLEIIVVDNGSSDENKAIVDGLKVKYKFNYIYKPMEFNFSAMCNIGVKEATGELILLMNDDIEVIQKDWLKAMVGQAMLPHVGAVGAKLLYANTIKIQHIGITNLTQGPSHKLCTYPDDVDYYYGRNRLTYDMIGVTAACLLVTKQKYDEVGGFDETMKVAYNDVDFCFKLFEAGYFNVIRNDAVLYHYESLSRGQDEEDDGKFERLLRERYNLYQKHPQIKDKDPFYHKDLVEIALEYLCNYKFEYLDKTYTVGTKKFDTSNLKLVDKRNIELYVDHAGLERSEDPDKKDNYWINGWTLVQGEDNALYKKQVLLKKTSGSFNEVSKKVTDEVSKNVPKEVADAEKGNAASTNKGSQAESNVNAQGKEEIYMVDSVEHFRSDVDRVLVWEDHVYMVGFTARLKPDELPVGSYVVGVLIENLQTGERVIKWSEKVLKVKAQ